jgi:uncharacterized protein (TIGR02186 family)
MNVVIGGMRDMGLWIAALWTMAATLLMVDTAPVRANDVPLVADLSHHLVAITTGFSGANVLLFGATDGPGDIVVVIRGPARDVAVRRKERMGPVWVNATAVTLHDVPSYYRMASTRPLEELAPDFLLQRYQIGFQNIRLDPTKAKLSDAELADFRAALVRLKANQGLYSEDLGSVNLMANRLFRTELFFPADVPTGTYLVEVYLFRNGAVAAAEIVPFTISKIGPAADIYDLAQQHGIIYGLLAVVTAILAGYGASAAFRRT